MYHPAWNGQKQPKRVKYHALDQRGLGADGGSPLEVMWSPTARIVGGLAMGYHGYKRSGSILWALVWSVLGSASPPLTSVVAVAQGYGKKKKGK